MEKRRYEAVMLKEIALPRATKEMIATAVSAANRCGYCIEHHVAFMVGADVDPKLARSLASDHATARLDQLPGLRGLWSPPRPAPP